MSTNHDPTTPGMPPAKPRKPRWRRWYVLTPAGLLAAFIAMGVIGSVAAGSAKPAPAASRPSASAPAAAPKSAAYPAQAANKALCATFNAGDTASIQAALDQAGGSVSLGLAKDVQAALDGSSYSQDVTAQIHVHMDCALVSVGKAPPTQGFSGSTASSQPSSAPATDPAPAAPTTTAPAAPATSAPAAPAGPTVSQQQALDSAQSYLGLDSGFSRQGLIDQLDSPYGGKFSVADATWATDDSGADWDAQAVLAAKGYMNLGTGFSRSGLIDQLDSPYGGKFTLAQATYAANHVGL
jgi:hypothetical protein